MAGRVAGCVGAGRYGLLQLRRVSRASARTVRYGRRLGELRLRARALLALRARLLLAARARPLHALLPLRLSRAPRAPQRPCYSHGLVKQMMLIY